MQALAAYILRGPLQAGGMVGLFGLLSLVFPPSAYLSGGAVALVTLRLGLSQGALSWLVAMLFAAAVCWLSLGSLRPVLALVGGIWLPTWLLAPLLGVSRSQGVLLLGCCGLALLLALGFRLLVDDPVQWWSAWISDLLVVMLGEGRMPEASQIAALAKLMTSLLAAGFTLNLMFNLLLGRWWQSLVANPGGFSTEFRQLRLPRGCAVVLIAASIVVALRGGLQEGGMVSDLLLVGIVAFTLQGLAVVHDYCARRPGGMAILLTVYFVLFFTGLYGLMLVALLGLADSLGDFRGLATGRTGQ
ncbi:MAG: hypothetical protein D6786_07815 [Gammaproteobacteria bacterium]|nr:MAG: hypothetical protein D6786_07815 [Gammaproteobacteria bacterium]